MSFSHHMANVQEHTAEKALVNMLAKFYTHFGAGTVEAAIERYREAVRVKEEAEK